MTYDVIIIGTGAMGSAAAYHLAKRNKRVLGIDRFSPPHGFGSSHGETRIIREAYYEGPQYVPILRKAYENWESLERDSGDKLYFKTGGLMIGPPESKLVSGARQSAELHEIPYETLDAKEICERFPAFHPSMQMQAIWEPRAGILFPEKCIAAHLKLARKHGAELQFGEPAISWKKKGNEFLVTTSKGEFSATQLLLTPGAWLERLVPELNLPLTVTRQVLFWFQPKKNLRDFELNKLPIYMCSFENDRIFYGFPNLDKGVKVAIHHEGGITDPAAVNRDIDPEEIESMRNVLKQFMPDAAGDFLSATVCLYTNTPDSNFLIFRHPLHSQLLIASICSGHGFKFASAFGEILSDLLLEGNSDFDLSLFMKKV